MIRKTSLVLALAAFASASAFAGGDKISSTSGSSVSSGTGVIVTQGASSSSMPSTLHSHPYPGGTQVQASQTTVMGGPAAGGIASSQTVVTRYWVNVPAGVERRADFQRWSQLR
jgi:hypothetical protein